MTALSLQNQTEVSEKSIQKTKLEKNFTIISNDLFDFAITGTNEVTAAAFQTLIFILKLHPDTIVTPKNISKIMKKAADRTGGKYKKPDTISRELRQLESAGYARRKYHKDKQGKFSGGTYTIFSDNTIGKKFPMGENDVKQPTQKGKINENTDLSIGEKIPMGAIYKEREHNGIKINSNSKSPVGKDSEQKDDTAALLEVIKKELKNQPPFGNQNSDVDGCIEKHGPEYTLEAIRLSKMKVPLNPGAYFNGAFKSNEGYPSIKAAIYSKQNPIKTSKTMSENDLPGYRNDFLQAILNKVDPEKFDEYLNMLDDELEKDIEFKSFLDRNGFKL